jgi:NAD(P)-dependent dehydrogenase (short-subunit alcohol dehydrogenase family)
VELEGGVAVVTGAGSGLGASLAKRFADAGMRVAVADIALENARNVASTIASSGGDASAMEVDLGDEASIVALAQRVEGELGPCQVLCSNVGVQQFGTVESLSRADWEWVLGVNVVGSALAARLFLPQLRRAEGDRRIVMTASTSSLYPAAHMAAYVSSKYALLGLVESLRLELAEEGIGVSAILPGPMRTTHLTSSQAAKPSDSDTPVFTPESASSPPRRRAR